MTKLQDYLKDGAGAKARAVLAYLQENEEIKESWDQVFKRYMAKVKIARWENCREQGYIVSLKDITLHKQLNIAFFEHRNSDKICAVRWDQLSLNSLTINTAKFKNIYKNKWDISKSVSYNKAYEMADWIWLEFEKFWNKNKEGKGENYDNKKQR